MIYTITAIIRPHLIEAVSDALHDLNLRGYTVTDCRGEGRHKAPVHSFRGSQYGHTLQPYVRIEMLVPEAQLSEAVKAIQRAAFTGEIGDGKIFVTEVKEVVRIRTGEHGDIALT